MENLKYTDVLPNFMYNLVNIRKANKMQYNWLYEHACFHRHRYSIHFNCFLKKFGIEEKRGFLDIETSNLKADFGIVLCWCILDDEGHLYEDWLTKDDIMSDNEDKRVIETCIETMNKFDRIVTHFGTYFDIPFLRTRALVHGLKFPQYGNMYHTDVWKMAKKSLCIHSNRQGCVAEVLQGKTIKTRIDHPSWRKAAFGNKEAMKEVVDHCEKDVPDLRKNYHSLLPFVREIRTSI